MEEDEKKKERVFHFIGSKLRVLPYPKKHHSTSVTSIDFVKFTTPKLGAIDSMD